MLVPYDVRPRNRRSAGRRNGVIMLLRCNGWCALCRRQENAKRRTRAQLTGDLDATVVRLDDALDDAEPQSGASAGWRPAGFNLVEPVKDVWQVFWRNT